MPLRWQEVALPLLLIVVLIALKYVPATADLPLARAAGVVAFAYAAFMALRLVQSEEAYFDNGWSALRPSLVEYFACYGAAILAVVLMSAIILAGGKAVDSAQMVAAFIASVALAGGAAAIALTGLFVKVRWNTRKLEHRTAFGKLTTIAWTEVVDCEPNWRGVRISTADRRRVVFSQFHGGAAELAKHATNRALRNRQTATKAFATT